jgi:phosphatidylglycerol:prolipoprotein diacylglycerol transferase
MLPILHIGPLAVQTPGLILLIALWIGLDLSEKHALKHATLSGQVYNLAFVSIIAGVLGARLAYAARYPDAFLKSPLGLLSLSPQMLDPFAGLAFAGLALLVYAQRKRLPLLTTLDVLTSLLSVMAVALGLANLASGASFGAPADLPWAVDLWGARRHPTQVYQILAALVVLIAVWPAAWNPLARRLLSASGARFWLFLALSAFARILVEAFRGDSQLFIAQFRQAQVLAWLLLALSLWQLGRRLFKTN